jgi:uncharacterized protein Yka (UPF0111/DUF47 family)
MERETLTELTFLLDRVADTLGTIAPVMQLAKGKNVTEKKRLLQSIVDLAFRGQRALKALSQQWALVLEENEGRLSLLDMDDFADIFQEAKRITIPGQASCCVGEAEAAPAFCDFASNCATLSSESTTD